MTLTVDATYENGMLKLAEPVPLKDHEKVKVTILSGTSPSRSHRRYVALDRVPRGPAKLLRTISSEFWRRDDLFGHPCRRFALLLLLRQHHLPLPHQIANQIPYLLSSKRRVVLPA